MIALRYAGDGDFKALRPKAADAEYMIGVVYQMEEHKPRSIAAHNFFFAAVTEGWRNLREEDAERFPTPEALRKYALIRAGYRDERTLVCSSKAEAQRVASFIRPMDDYAIVTVSEAVVRVWTAKSQSTRAMGRKEFNQSIEDVLGVIAQMIGVSPDQLRQEGKRDAA